MKNLTALFPLLPFIANADYFPNAAQDEFDNVPLEYALIQRVELVLHMDMARVSVAKGKEYGLITCEMATLVESWRNVRFERMRIENRDGNQGVTWWVNNKECEKITLSSDSDAELDRKYFGRDRFNTF